MRDGLTLRLGDYRDVLADEQWDALIVDPPYSSRTHTGQANGTLSLANLERYERTVRAKMERGESPSKSGAMSGRKLLQAIQTQQRRAREAGTARGVLEYAPWSEDDVRAFVAWAHERTRGWMVCFCDDTLAPVYRSAMDQLGRFTFPAVAWYWPRGQRIAADGPACWTTWICVSRPSTREWATWRSLPGGYHGPQDRPALIGGKPVWLMRALVHDYTNDTHVVCDPCAGWGTTLIGAHLEGRRAIGAERDEGRYNAALERLRGLPPNSRDQLSLWGDP